MIGVRCVENEKCPRVDCKHFSEHKPIEKCDEGFECPIRHKLVRCGETVKIGATLLNPEPELV